jgi:hypothetical protein
MLEYKANSGYYFMSALCLQKQDFKYGIGFLWDTEQFRILHPMINSAPANNLSRPIKLLIVVELYSDRLRSDRS